MPYILPPMPSPPLSKGTIPAAFPSFPAVEAE